MHLNHRPVKQYLVIGRKEEIGDVLKEIEEKSLHKIKFVEYINPSPTRLINLIETRYQKQTITQTLKSIFFIKEPIKSINKEINSVVVTDPQLEKLVKDEVENFKRNNIPIEYLPELAEKYLKRIPIKVIQKFEEYYTLEFGKKENDPSKRISDIIISTLLIILFSPFMLIIAVWTLIEDGTPVVFRQNRIGYKGKTFRLSKFRSLKNIDEKISSKCVRGGDHESGEEFRGASAKESNTLNKQQTTNTQQQKSHGDFTSGEEFRNEGSKDSVILSESKEPKDLRGSKGPGDLQQDCHPEPAEGSNGFDKQQTTNNKQPESQSDSYTPNDGIEQRVLKIGKITRKTRLDETLQFWNVLNGTMSIVGSRPEMEEFHKEMKEKIPYYAYRLDTNPGITGWAQINYKHTTTLEDYIKKTEYDLYYVKNRTLLLDIQIMLKTVETMFGMRGAR
jgi:lipopolysaccharide/colanic/teichoic acid biosynthesis glycosyltransferase